MVEASDKDQRKTKINEVKTFSIPFAIEGVKENISISNNSVTKRSKEQLINKAIQFHLKGNISEASKYYQQLINEGCNDHRVFSNYGTILKDLGNLAKAEASFRKAIELKPDLAEAHSNLGNILRDLGKLQEAELLYRKAIELKPDYPNAHYNLGNVLRDLGNLQEAELLYRKAVELNPDLAKAHLNLGNVLSDLGKSQDAVLSHRKAIEIKPDIAEAYSNLGNILNDLGQVNEAFDSYLKSIEINPTVSNIYTSISIFLRDSDLSQLDKSKIKKVLNILLERNDVSHEELFKAFNFVYSNEIKTNLEKLDSDSSTYEFFINDNLIINALKKIVFKDPIWERLLIKLRRDICKYISNKQRELTNLQLKLFIALAEQCFSNEYIYSVEVEETESLNKIINICKGSKLTETNLCILACYLPLYKLLDQIPSIQDFKSKNNNFNELIKLQVFEPLEEIKISKEIKKIGSITDNISQKVRSQYEENPYPRWKYYSLFNASKSSAILLINNHIKPNSISSNLESKELKILIAGCGTGMQILQAQRYRNAQITAIDISNSSLSFAQRKINEIGIKNVNLFQMDILEVALLKEKFDIIECCGVLHHMADPQQGLKALLEIFNPKGYIRLSLYSELSRQRVVKAREYIKAKNINPNIDNMRNLRKDILSGKCPELYSLTGPDCDFYTTSNFRDLCFHYQEHRFTFKQLEDTLIFHKLKFLGFCLPQQTKSLYKKYFPEDTKQTNLKNWGEVESKHPGIFGGTPHFWVSKGE